MLVQDGAGWPCWLLSVEGWSLMAVVWSFCPPERCPCVAMAGDSGSPFRVRPLVWSDGDQQYVHERNVGTQQALPALMWCSGAGQNQQWSIFGGCHCPVLSILCLQAKYCLREQDVTCRGAYDSGGQS